VKNPVAGRRVDKSNTVLAVCCDVVARQDITRTRVDKIDAKINVCCDVVARQNIARRRIEINAKAVCCDVVFGDF
jgi:hypothetical protein